jgi:hypothetical protein
MGWAAEHRFTHDPRVLNRATWSARQGSRLLRGWLITWLVPPDATLVLGADDPRERRRGRKIAAKGCYRPGIVNLTAPLCTAPAWQGILVPGTLLLG